MLTVAGQTRGNNRNETRLTVGFLSLLTKGQHHEHFRSHFGRLASVSARRTSAFAGHDPQSGATPGPEPGGEDNCWGLSTRNRRICRLGPGGFQRTRPSWRSRVPRSDGPTGGLPNRSPEFADGSASGSPPEGMPELFGGVSADASGIAGMIDQTCLCGNVACSMSQLSERRRITGGSAFEYPTPRGSTGVRSAKVTARGLDETGSDCCVLYGAVPMCPQGNGLLSCRSKIR